MACSHCAAASDSRATNRHYRASETSCDLQQACTLLNVHSDPSPDLQKVAKQERLPPASWRGSADGRALTIDPGVTNFAAESGQLGAWKGFLGLQQVVLKR